MAAQSTYGVNANYLVSHAIVETGWGKTSPIIVFNKNLFSYGSFDNAPDTSAAMFPSEDYSIRFRHGWFVPFILRQVQFTT